MTKARRGWRWLALVTAAGVGVVLWAIVGGRHEPGREHHEPERQQSLAHGREGDRESSISHTDDACGHPFSLSAGHDGLVYELRLGAQRERLTFRTASSESTDGITRLRWRATYETGSGPPRIGDFESRCSTEAVDLPIDAFGTAGSRLQVPIPRFPVRAVLTDGERWCQREQLTHGYWERCFDVVETGVEVHTPAGTFETTELLRSDAIHLDDRELEDRSRVWLAEGIGVVKLERDGVDGVTELVRILGSS